MPCRAAEPAEGLARCRRLGRGVVDPESAERIDDGARPEQVLNREPQSGSRLAPGELSRSDHGDTRAHSTAGLLGEGRAGDGRGVSDGTQKDGRRGVELCGSCRDGGAVQRDGMRGGIQRHRLARVDAGGDVRAEPEDVHDHDDIGEREGVEARSAPLEAHLVAGLVERRGHPSRLERGRCQTGRMRILLKLVLDCDADAAWRALHSPRAVADLYGPFVELVPMDAAGLPSRLDPGADVPVRMRVAGAPLGDQLIHISERHTEDAHGPVRILRDSGIPLTGPLASLDVWDHQMAVSPAPGDASKTLWRDRLVIGGGAAPALWPVLWATWQWRGARLRALAPTWAHDPETENAQGDAAAEA